MKTSTLEALLASFDTIAEELRSALGEKPPATMRSSLQLIPGMPVDIEDLPAYFDRITDEQFKTIWVCGLASCLAERDDKVTVGMLVPILVRIRDRYAACKQMTTAAPEPPRTAAPAPALETPAADQTPPPASQDVPEPPSAVQPPAEPSAPPPPRPAPAEPSPWKDGGRIRWDRVLEHAKRVAPNPGDTVMLAQEFPDITTNQLRMKLELSKAFVCRASPEHRTRGRWDPIVAFRTAN